MKKRYNKFLLLVSCFTLVFAFSKAQDPTFSQFYNKEMYYNPAFTGINSGLRVLVTDRELWANAAGAHNTASFALDFYDVRFGNGGLGLIFTNAVKGESYMHSTSTGLQYAKRIGITPDFIMQIGASAAYYWNRLEMDHLSFPDQFDARFGNIYQTEFQIDKMSDGGLATANFFDFSAGFLARFNIKQTPIKPLAINTLGFALHHLSQPNLSYLNDSEAILPMKFTAHWYSMFRIGMGGFKYDGHFLLAPGVLYETQAKSEDLFDMEAAGFRSLNFGVNAFVPMKLSFISQINLGVWTRKQFMKVSELQEIKERGSKTFDALIWQLGYHYIDRYGKRLYRVNYSYDMTVSTAGFKTGGSHEITLIIELQDLALPGGKRKWGYVKNPNDLFFHR